MAIVERRAAMILAAAAVNATVAITDLNTGVAATVGGDTERYPGCTLNLLVLMSVVRDVATGVYPLEQVDADILYTIRNSSAERARDLLVLTGEGDTARGVEKVNALALELGMAATLVEKMTHVKPGLNYLIQAGVPVDAAAAVAHKNGYFQTDDGDWVDNDVGIVWSTNPANPYVYAISMFFHDLPEQFGPEIFTGQRLSSLAWNWFEEP